MFGELSFIEGFACLGGIAINLVINFEEGSEAVAQPQTTRGDVATCRLMGLPPNGSHAILATEVLPSR